MGYELKLFSGNANRPLAEEIAKTLQVPLGDADVSRFSDGEVYVQINENVRGQDVFVVQPTCPPVNDNLMELLVMMDAFKRASARRITAVLPYYGYGRQDRKVMPRVPITAKLVADLITAAGCHRVLAVDLHAGQIQGFFNIPVDHLFAAPRCSSTTSRRRTCRTSCSCRRTPAAWSARAPSRSGSRRAWPSSTSGATAPTWPCSCT